MSWDQPAALWLLLALVPLLFVRRLVPRQQRRAAHLHLWAEPGSRSRAGLSRRVARHRRFWLHAAIVTTLVLALAGPQLGWTRPVTVVVLDVSMSMGAREGTAPTRLDEATGHIGRLVDRLPFWSRVRVYLAGPEPQLLGEFRSSDPALAAALQAVTPTDAAADVMAAVERARAEAPDARETYIVSDAVDALEAPTLTWISVGRPVPNIALTLLSIAEDDRGGQHALVEGWNFGTQDMRADVVVAAGGTVLGRRQFDFPAGAGASHALPIASVDGVVHATLEVADGLAADNVRFARVHPRAPIVTELRGRSRVIEQALAAHPQVQLVTSLGTTAGGVEPGLVVCVGCLEAPRTAPTTAVLLIAPPEAESQAAAAMVVTAPAHPMMQHVAVAGAVVVPAVRPALPETAEVLARAGGKPAILAAEPAGRRMVAFAFDPDASAASLDVAFPLLIAETVAWLTRASDAALNAGDTLRLPMASGDPIVIGPDGRPRPHARADATVIVGDTATAGVYQVTSADARELVAVNPSVAEESDLSRQPSPSQVGTVTPRADLARGPATVALLLLACGLLSLEWWLSVRRSAMAMGAHLRRGAALVCLTLALSGVRLPFGAAPQSAMVVADESGSMAGASSSVARRLVADKRESDRAGLIVFGTQATIAEPLATELEWNITNASAIGTTTNIEAALRLARRELSRTSAARMILISDGRQTAGDALVEATRARLAGIPIDVVALAPREAPALDVSAVAAPAVVRINDPFNVVVSTRGEAGARGVVTLATTSGDVQTAAITLGEDGVGTTTFAVRGRGPGTYVYEAHATPADDSAVARVPRRDGAVVAVAGDTRVLYVGSAPDTMAPLADATGFQVDRWSSADLPRAASALFAYDVIVLDRVRPDLIAAPQAAALRAHVERQGGGLIVLGDRLSLDAGAMASHPLADMLPVDVRPRGGTRAPALGLVVAFDKSGSMDDRVDGVPRIEFARLAVRRVFDAIPASDALGVIAFDATAHEVAPLRAGHDLSVLAAALQDVRPSGSTAIAPALAMASEWLTAAGDGLRRHVLLVSDGRTTAADAARMREVVNGGGFQLSVVALGSDADRELLQGLATETGGQAYFPADVRELPAIVARESARVAGGLVVETPFQPIMRPHAVNAMAQAEMPRLGGYVVTAAKSSAASALTSPLDDPILATWRVGLGRVSAYTANLAGPWSAPLRRWSGFGEWLTGLTRWTARRVRDGALYASFHRRADGVQLLVEAANGAGPVNGLTCRADVRGPDGHEATVELRATGHGRYEATLAATAAGPYVVAITAASRDQAFDSTIVRGTYWSADEEYGESTAALPLLARIADLSGGRVLNSGDLVFDGPRTVGSLDVWPWLVIAAITLFLVEILLRPLWAARRRARWSGAADVRREAA